MGGCCREPTVSKVKGSGVVDRGSSNGVRDPSDLGHVTFVNQQRYCRSPPVVIAPRTLACVLAIIRLGDMFLKRHSAGQ
jgi:hypothetical protein